MLCLFVGVRGEAPDAEPGERLGKTLARLITPEIEVDGALPPAPIGEEPGEAVRQSEVRGELGAVIGTAENPDLRNRVGLWIRLDHSERMVLEQRLPIDPGHQIADIGGKVFGPLMSHRVEGEGGAPVGSRRPAQPQVNPARRESVEHPELLCYHDDPILRDGQPVGRTTSAMWSYTQDRCLAMGYLQRVGAEGVDQAWLDAGRFEINIGGRLVAATPSIRSFYDPGNQRVRLEDGP